MTDAIKLALEEIAGQWPEAKVTTSEAANEVTRVVVDGLPIGPKYEPQTTWIGFDLPHNYPDPDVYPHFMPLSVRRVDNSPLGESFATTAWHGEQMTQISRRTANWNGAVDTAEGKLIKVLDFIRSRP